MSSETVLISVIIPTFGRPDFLLEAIKSVLVQDHSRVELIVVDDNGRGTTDQQVTSELLMDYISNINYLINEHNLGVAASRNRGASEAKGDYIAFLDDDDVFEPNKLSVQVGAMQLAGADISVCGFLRTDSHLNILGEVQQPALSSTPDFLNNKVHTQASTQVVSREYFRATGGFPEDLSYREDTIFVMRVLAAGAVPLGINQPLFKHRAHAEGRLSAGAGDVGRLEYTYTRWCEEQDPLLAQVPDALARYVRFQRAYKHLKDKRRSGLGVSVVEMLSVMRLAAGAHQYGKALATLKYLF